MTITVKYFGLLTDVTQTNEEQFSLEVSPITVSQLRTEIEKKHPLINKSNYRIAVNQSISDLDFLVNNNDTIALLPPFAGG